MAKQLHISIPQPCHENWDAMTPTAQGAFCKSCRKNVIDFSCKTENEIYNIINDSEETLCGRFTVEQLQQPIRKTEMVNGWFNWRAVAASLAAFFSFGKLDAGDLEPKSKKVCTQNQSPDVVIQATRVIPSHQFTTTGIMVTGEPVHQIQSIDTGIRGKVIDANTKEPLIGATVHIKNTGIRAVVDIDGSFVLRAGTPNKSGTLVVQYLGYYMKELSLQQFNAEKPIELTMHEQIMIAGGIRAMPVKGKVKKK